MDKTVSIIVPMYHGKKFLDDILMQIEQCVQEVPNVDVELILYNDSPDEKIYISEKKYTYKIRVFNPGFNSGIHGARVQALKKAKGDYILFLDQDDKIVPTYLVSQLEAIGNADAVVCRAIHNKRLHYTNTHVFEKVISKEFMLRKWCPIVSPGQVLIKRTSIPQLWQEKIVKHNGADDYFLWLLMVGERKSFSLNQDILFEHVVTESCTSENTNEMMDSEMEMIEILKESGIFEGEDKKWFSELLNSLRRIHIKELDNYKRVYRFLYLWNMWTVNGNPPEDFFRRNHIKRIAIYGAGDLGKSLELLLKNTEIKVSFYIDQNAEYIISELPVYKKEDMHGGVDAIIMTIKDNGVKREVENLAECPVFEVEEIWE